MIEPDKIKLLICAYLDGEATPQEQTLVRQRIKEDAEWKKYYQDLSKLSATLHICSDEDLSPDLEQRIHTTLQKTQEREGQSMRGLSLNRRMALGGTLVVGLLVFVAATQVYVKRGMQARMGDIGDDHSIGKTGIEEIPLSEDQLEYAHKNSRQKKDGPVASPRKVARVDSLDRYSEPLARGETKTVLREPSRFAYMNKSTEEGDKEKFSEDVTSSKLLANETTRVNLKSKIKNAEQSFWGGRNLVEQRRAEVDGFVAPRSDSFSPRKRVLEPPPVERKLWKDRDIHDFNTEQYDRIYENEFLSAIENPLSTFSIDVDTASYSNVRRFLNNGQLPPPDAVRIEEMINYFVYDYQQPQGEAPFSINIEGSPCPWNAKHQLAMIGLQGRDLTREDVRPSNLVFLIDVSGSMNTPQKLPLLKSAFKMLANQLRDDERIAIVTYAGSAGLVLDSTTGYNKGVILDAIDRLQAGGSTAGGAGITLAYKVAHDNFIRNGNNRVILATDGDFNIGVTNDGELTRLIEGYRKDGIYLSILGFGSGNYKDSKIEKLADRGNGNYFYIDTEREARKVLVQELGSMLFAIAKDVKVQIEFNPARVQAYRLVGYENRILAKEDFNNDEKDAGELGAGHSVTALYEIVPAEVPEDFPGVDSLKYQKTFVNRNNELFTVKLRYKMPQEETSRLITRSIDRADVISERTSSDLMFASAVAEFGLLLRNSPHRGNSSFVNVIDRARHALGIDRWGYRAEFITLVEKAGLMAERMENPDAGSDVMYRMK